MYSKSCILWPVLSVYRNYNLYKYNIYLKNYIYLKTIINKSYK